jgi:hypothetical protein
MVPSVDSDDIPIEIMAYTRVNSTGKNRANVTRDVRMRKNLGCP